MEELSGLIVFVSIMVISIFALKSKRRKASAQRDEFLDRQAAREEEILVGQDALLAQGEEIIELLKSLNVASERSPVDR